MHTLTRGAMVFSVCLSMLAGYVDALGFLELGRYFVSFMSGNSTQLAVGIVNGGLRTGLLAGIIFFFVLGACLGTLINQLAPKSRQSVAVLLCVTFLLVISATCYALGAHLPGVLSMALAMGLENTVLQRADNVVHGVTYMTGTLVKAGQQLAFVLLGKKRFSWVPYLMLWCGLVSGGMTGALLFHFFGIQSLWGVAAWAGILTLMAWRARLKA